MFKLSSLSGHEKKLFFTRLIITLAVFATISTIQITLLVGDPKPYHYVIPALFSLIMGSFIGWHSVLQQRLELSNRIKSDFLESMSHELRTPLTVIIGFSKLMDKEEDLNLRGHEFARRINLSGEHLLSIINNILDFSFIESGKLNLHMRKIYLNKLLSECVQLMTPIAEQAGISLTTDITDEAIHIEADELRMKQAILNLLSNAIKYNKENGKVILKLESDAEHHYRIAIEDTGVGIPAHAQKKIFHRFERLDRNSNKVRGAGLGLSISQSLVNMMGGELSFRSLEGVGSSFYIDITNMR